MANSSAKKVIKANAARLNRLRITILLANIAYFLVRFVLLRSTFDSFYLTAWILLSVVTALAFYFLSNAARPRYFDDGSLMDGGEDISSPGVLEYAHDLIYLAVLVQFGLLLTKWALLILAIVPIYGIYASCCSDGNTNHPVVNEAETPDFAAMSRKERRKMEREARKQR